MKAKPIFSLLMVLFCLSLQAQNVKMKANAIGTYSQMSYLGKDSRYYYFITGTKQYTRFAIGNLQDFKDITYSLQKDDDGYASHYFSGGNLYVVSTETERNESTKMKTSTFRYYQLDPENGKILKENQYEAKDSTKYYYYQNMDTTVRKFFVKRSDSIVNAIDFDLQTSSDLSPGKRRYQPSLSFGLSDELKDLFKSLSLKLNIVLSSDGDNKYKDSTSMTHYAVSFTRRKDEDIYFFKATLQGVVITSKHADNRVKSVDFSIDADKTIIDINYREDKDGKLVVFGKYIVKGKTQSQYGMFSAVYSSDLNEVTNVKYFDLNNYYNFTETVPNMKYVGFIFSKLFDPEYEFYIESENVFVFTYQQAYSNLQDHIYVMKVESNGEITVHMIVNRLDQKTKSGYNEKHMAVRAGNNIHILFYDHKDNIGREIRDVEYSNGHIDKKTCVLMTTTYNILEDDFSKKTMIADRKTLKNLPHLDSPVIHFDTNLNQYICLVKGYNKKRDTVLFYEFLYVD